jgi:hypothetical protein
MSNSTFINSQTRSVDDLADDYELQRPTASELSVYTDYFRGRSYNSDLKAAEELGESLKMERTESSDGSCSGLCMDEDQAKAYLDSVMLRVTPPSHNTR